MGSLLDVHVLGGHEVRRPDGDPIQEWGRPTGRRLLCLVLLSPGRVVTREAAMAALFPQAGDRAANALAKAVHWCRQALGEPWQGQLVSAAGEIGWSGPVLLDADPVLRLARHQGDVLTAEELRGLAQDERQLLPGWDEEWVEPFREELRLGRQRAGALLGRSLEDSGPEGLEAAIGIWRRLVDADEVVEEHHTGLVRSLIAAGRADDARAAYVRCRRVLWTELGVEPGAELETWLRRHRTVVAGEAMPVPHLPPMPREGDSSAGGWRAAATGRDEELAEILDHLAPTSAGHGTSLTLVGSAGVGKTELLRATADRWRSRGWLVAETAGRSGGGPAYSTASTALARLLGDEATDLTALLAPAARRDVPTTRQERADDALHERVADLLDRVAWIPTLVVVDDLDDADPASVRLVHHLARRGGPRLWSVVAATRYPQATLPGSHLVGVQALPTEVVRAIVGAKHAGAGDAAISLAAERSEGNPLFALELAALLTMSPEAPPIPPSAVALLRQRLSLLPPGQRLLMPLVVIAGDDATWPVLRLAAARLPDARLPDARLPDADLTEALDRLRDADLVSQSQDRSAPAHPLIGEAALALLRRSQRAALHDAVADALAELGASPPSVAHHRVSAFEHAPRSDRAVAAARAAHDVASAALAQGRDAEAAAMARCVQRAWASCDAGDRRTLDALASDAQLILGHALAVSAPSEAAAAYENGRRKATDDETRGRFLLAEGWLHYMHGDLARASQVYQRGLALPDTSGPMSAALLTHLGWVHARQGLYDRGLALCDEALEAMSGCDDPLVLGTVLDRRSMILAFLGSTDEARMAADCAYEVATAAGDASLLSVVQGHRGNICGRLGDWEAALRYLDEAVELARSAGDAYVESVAWWARTDVLTRQGDLPAALAANAEEERALRLTGNPVHLAACARRRRRLLGEDDLTPATPAGRTP